MTTTNHDSFPLTATQEAYLVGRGTGVDFGEVGCQGYWEWRRPYQPGDEDKVRDAWSTIVERHPSLRTVITADRSSQTTLPPGSAWTFTFNDWSQLSPDQADDQLTQLRDHLSHHLFDPNTFPLWDVQVSLMPDQNAYIHFSLDLLVADAWSYYQVLVPEFAALLLGQDLPAVPDASFQGWVIAQERATRESASWGRAEQYWVDRLPSLPPAPQLPRGSGEGTEFTRLEDAVDAHGWAAIQKTAGKRRVAGTALVAAALGEVLRRWGAGEKFTITVPTFVASRASEAYAGVVGDFTSTILLEVDGSGDSFTARAQTVQRQLWSDLPHSAFSGIHVAREMARTSGATQVSFPFVLTSLLGQPPRRYHTDLGVSTYTSTRTPQVSVDVQVAEVEGALAWSWDFRRSAFPPGLIEDMFTEFGRVFRDLSLDDAWDSADCIAELPPHQAAARARANSTDGPVPANTLGESFWSHVESRPTATALVSETGDRVTYAELAQAARNVAGAVAASAHDDGPVAIVLAKQVAQFVAAQAASYAGRTFVALDPDQPLTRLQRAFDSARPALVIADEPVASALASITQAPVITVAQARAHEALQVSATPPEACYVVYTSGTSGRPKGVVVGLAGVANAFAHMSEIGAIDHTDVAYAVSPFHFDLGMFEALGMPALGGTVVVAPPVVDPLKWLADVQRERVTVWNSTPALLSLLLDAAESQGETLTSLRTVILAGDRIPGHLPHRLAGLAPSSRLIASGGPAETCVWSVYYPVPVDFPASSPSVPYGLPMRNQRYLLLDQLGRDVPDWVEGEMVVESEVGLAEGYLNLPDETAEKFSRAAKPGTRRYVTGDMGRWRPDGLIEITGRKDFQVKVNGVRIELGEVVEALKTLPDVHDAVVVQAGGTSDSPLVAFTKSDNVAMSEAATKTHVSNLLPRAAVPARVIVVPQFPLTPNGKVDLLSLQKTAAEAVAAAASQDDGSVERDAIEVVLSACWLSLLGHRIGRDDNFFSVGGTSLDVAKATMRFSSLTEFDVDARTMFIHPTVRSAARALLERHGQEMLNRCKLITNA
jgi:amino acid adenylation domain-containing protein